jgi:hypothetical protein
MFPNGWILSDRNVLSLTIRSPSHSRPMGLALAQWMNSQFRFRYVVHPRHPYRALSWCCATRHQAPTLEESCSLSPTRPCCPGSCWPSPPTRTQHSNPIHALELNLAPWAVFQKHSGHFLRPAQAAFWPHSPHQLHTRLVCESSHRCSSAACSWRSAPLSRILLHAP